MTGLEIVHPVPLDEITEWQRTFALALLHPPAGAAFEMRLERRRRAWPTLRTWGARDGDAWVASLATTRLPLSVPGRSGGPAIDVDVDGVTAVGTSATHRRRGLLRRMITDALSEAAERGDPMSMLVAAEWPIYGRYGYAPAVSGATYRLQPRRSGGVTGAAPDAVRASSPDEIGRLAPAIFDAARRNRAGGVGRPGDWWRRKLGLDGWPIVDDERLAWFVHQGADGPDGVLAWRPTADSDLVGGLGSAEVGEFFAATPAAYRDLWGYLCSLDLIGEVELDARPVDEPIRWLLGDARALERRHTFDHVWLRMLDVPAALRTRRYAVPGRLVLEVTDPLGGWAAGRYVLDADGDEVSCERTDADPEVRLDQRALAASYLGGTRPRDLVATGWVDERRVGAVARMQAMFAADAAPWNQTGF